MTSNSSARKRGGTFHQDNIHQHELAIHYIDEPNINKLSIVNDTDDDLDQQSIEETLPRGRSRSRSVHENDGPIPYVLNQPDLLNSISNQNDNPNNYNITHSSRTVDDNNNPSIDNTDKEIKRR